MFPYAQIPPLSTSISPALIVLAAVCGALVFTILVNSSEIEVTFGRLRLVFRLRGRRARPD
jgi:hypothetical protein